MDHANFARATQDLSNAFTDPDFPHDENSIGPWDFT
jgi:hypothetical protein